MATTLNYSTTKVEIGQAQKEATINEAFDTFDAVTGGQLTKSVAGSSNVALTRTEGLNAYYVFTGVLTGNIQVSWPASGGKARVMHVYNATTGAFSLTLVVAGGSGVAVTQTELRTFVVDGTAVRAINTSAAGTYTAVSAQAVWARVYHNAAQSISNATDTILAFNSERADTDVIHDNVTNNSRLTCKTAGLYSITADVGFASNSTGLRAVAIKLNGTTVIGSGIVAAVNGAATRSVTSTEYALAVNDYVEVQVHQNSGGALNTEQAGNYTPEFMMVRLGGS